MTDNNNYLARVEQTVQEDIGPDTRIIALKEWDITEREGYWERVYMIAWQNDNQSGTHRAHIDSTGRGALFSGAYFEAPGDAIRAYDARVR